MINLQRTLDNRESEIDMLEKDLFECREIICTQIDARKEHEALTKQQTDKLITANSEIDELKVVLINSR